MLGESRYGAVSDDAFERVERFVENLDRPDKGDYHTETAESVAVVLHYLERCAFSHSEAFKDYVRQGEAQYVTLDTTPRSNQIAYSTNKSPSEIGTVINSHIADLYDKDDLLQADTRPSPWAFKDIIDGINAGEAVDPRHVREKVEQYYRIDVQEQLYDPREAEDAEEGKTPWYEKIPEPAQAREILAPVQQM